MCKPLIAQPIRNSNPKNVETLTLILRYSNSELRDVRQRRIGLRCATQLIRIHRTAIACWMLLMVSFALSGCGAESAKWNRARAKNFYAECDLASAIAALELANKQSPDDEDIKLHLAQLYAENGQCELGQRLCDDYIENHPNEMRGYRTRFNCNLYLGKFSRALKDYKKSLSDHASRDPVELNNLAYFRGLAKQEIDKAAFDIQSAIEEVEKKQNWGSRLLIPLQVRTVITAGLISRHIDRHERAIEHLDKKINAYDLKVRWRSNWLKTRITSEILTETPLPKEAQRRILNARAELESQTTSLAAMLSTRALIYEDLGKPKNADADRLKVHQLKYDFKTMVSRLPSDFSCLQALDQSIMFLDTRGFVLGRQTWSDDDLIWDAVGGTPRSPLLVSNYQDALADLDLAVLASKFKQLAMETSLYNTPDISAQKIVSAKKAASKMTAVLLHHRKEVHLRGGNKDAAASDQREINALGFTNCSLF